MALTVNSLVNLFEGRANKLSLQDPPPHRLGRAARNVGGEDGGVAPFDAVFDHAVASSPTRGRVGILCAREG